MTEEENLRCNVLRLGNEVRDLYEENKNLKAEFDKYRKAVTISADSVIDERDRLKAEVEHIKFWNEQLKAENDLLRKAGDAMQDRLGCKCGWLLCKGCQEAENNWEKAKEGKPSV